jgi:hypothetical protein
MISPQAQVQAIHQSRHGVTADMTVHLQGLAAAIDQRRGLAAKMAQTLLNFVAVYSSRVVYPNSRGADYDQCKKVEEVFPFSGLRAVAAVGRRK